MGSRIALVHFTSNTSNPKSRFSRQRAKKSASCEGLRLPWGGGERNWGGVFLVIDFLHFQDTV